MKNFLIIGAGAIGSFYGAKLSQAGALVDVWARSDYDLIKKNGIKILSNDGNINFTPNKIFKNLEECQSGYDCILIATKVLPNINIPTLIKDIVSKNTKIILVQNGIYIEDDIARSFPDNEIISAVAFVAVSRVSAGVINHQDYGRLTMGLFAKNYISLSLKELADLFLKSNVEVVLTENILLERWKKLVWNCAFNPLSVMLRGLNTKEIIENKNLRNLAIKIMEEVCVVAKSNNCELPNDIIEKNILATEKMKPYKTSMLLDFEAGRPMEVEAIVGNVISFAQSKSISTPYLSMLYAIISNL